MLKNPATKYSSFKPINLTDRQWPSRVITRAPIWMSTDLRDGNQALFEPMNAERKMRMFKTLVQIGFKEIEVAFPSASQTDFNFVRELIEGGHIPDDVTIEVLTQARDDLIERTFESLRGVPRAIVHLYNATAPEFRRIVFGLDKSGVKELAQNAARTMKRLADAAPETHFTLQYSPEVFSGTELEFAKEVCDAVFDIWQPTPEHKAIVNLPATVEMATPNVYADQIEWMHRNLARRDSLIVSVHPHNDRGTAVAAAELAVMAGADRVEGCLFGNGERTGNVDLVALALNMYTQGVSPELDFSDMREVVRTVEHCTNLPVHPRHPYAGELVFTAFSGSHQDAIRKGFAANAQRNDGVWDMPYLPIDPADLGESYEAVIRVNSQSGKGGVAWILEQNHGLKLPRRFQIDFSRKVQDVTDASAREVSSANIWAIFQDAYHLTGAKTYELVDYALSASRSGERHFTGRIAKDGQEVALSGRGNGLISGAVEALNTQYGLGLEVVDYAEHALDKGTGSHAVAYVECRTEDDRRVFGVGINGDIATASVKAILSAANSL